MSKTTGAKNWTHSFFSQTFRAPPGYSVKNPRKSLFSLGFEGHTELLGPHLFTWKTPTPPEEVRTKKFGFVLFFMCLKIRCCTIGPSRITRLIPLQFSGVTEVKFITPMKSLRIFWCSGWGHKKLVLKKNGNECTFAKTALLFPLVQTEDNKKAERPRRHFLDCKGRFESIAAPKKKYLAPPPPQFPNSPQTPSRPVGPSPSWRPPLLRFSIKNFQPPPPSWRLGLPLAPPRAEKIKNIRNVHCKGRFETGAGLLIGRTPKGAYSTRGRFRHLLETAFSEPLLRSLLRTLFLLCKTHRRPPSQNPSPEPLPQNPSQNLLRTLISERLVLPYAPLGVHPS